MHVYGKNVSGYFFTELLARKNPKNACNKHVEKLLKFKSSTNNICIWDRDEYICKTMAFNSTCLAEAIPIYGHS